MSLMSNLATVLKSSNDSWLGQVLKAGGLTILSATVIYTMVQTLVNTFISSLNGLPVSLLQLMGLAGVDTGFSIICGALLASAFLKSKSVSLGKKG